MYSLTYLKFWRFLTSALLGRRAGKHPLFGKLGFRHRQVSLGMGVCLSCRATKCRIIPVSLLLTKRADEWMENDEQWRNSLRPAITGNADGMMGVLCMTSSIG
jgi:hypothetical protein